MVHYNFELNETFNKTDFINYLDDAKSTISIKNGKYEIEFELTESIINKRFNNFEGIFEKYRILKNQNSVGFLEVFKNNDLNYLIIYTSEI